MWRIDDEYVGPRDKFLQNLLRAGRLQVERDAALVAVGKMPLIGVICRRLRRDLVPISPGVAARRLDLDDVGAEVGQDHRGAGRRNEAREVNYLQSGKNVVTCHWSLLNRRVYFTARGTAERVFRGRRTCPLSCPPSRRTVRSRRLPAQSPRSGSCPIPCSPRRARA